MSKADDGCKCKGCKRPCCISVNPHDDEFLQYCLLHFYGTKFAQDEYTNRVFILNKAAFQRQSMPTQQILQRVSKQVQEEFEQAYGPSTPITTPTLAAQIPIATTSSALHTSSPLIKKRLREEEVSKKRRSHLWSVKGAAKPKCNDSLGAKADPLVVKGDELNGCGFQVPSDISRKKVACMFKVALELSSKQGDIGKLALEIEAQLDCMYTDKEKAAYMKHARLLFKRLKDPLNTKLRAKVITKALTGKDLCLANDVDLLNPEARRERGLAQEKMMKQRTKGSTNMMQGTKTNSYECPMCRNVLDNLFTPLKVNLSHVSKTEVWGNKDNVDSDKVRVVCTKCNFEFYRESC